MKQFDERVTEYNDAIIVGTPYERAIVVTKAALADAYMEEDYEEIVAILIALGHMEPNVYRKADLFIKALDEGKENASLFLGATHIIVQKIGALPEYKAESVYNKIFESGHTEFEVIVEAARKASMSYKDKPTSRIRTAKPAEAEQ